MEAVNDALKLIAQALEIALVLENQELVSLLKAAIDTLASSVPHRTLLEVIK